MPKSPNFAPDTISTPTLNLSISLPQLQDLLIGSGPIFGSLEIYAPTLRVISLSGYIYHKLELHCSPLLEHTEFLLDIDPDTYRCPRYDSMENINILHITHVVFEIIYTAHYISRGRRLELNNLREFYLENVSFFKGCSALKEVHLHMIYTVHYVSGERRLELNNLREFHLGDVKNFNSVYPLVRFFRGCSALEEVHIHFCGTSGPNLDVEQLEALRYEKMRTLKFGNYFFCHLKRVFLTGFSGELKKIILVKFLLQAATTLHLLHLQMNKMLPKDLKFVLEYIFSLPRISPRAAIQYVTSWDLS